MSWDFTCKQGILKNVLIIGTPASLTSILMGICQMLINSQMSVYGDLAVADIISIVLAVIIYLIVSKKFFATSEEI